MSSYIAKELTHFAQADLQRLKKKLQGHAHVRTSFGERGPTDCYSKQGESKVLASDRILMHRKLHKSATRTR